MMRDIIITVENRTRAVLQNTDNLGVAGENLQGNIIVDFDDEFIDGYCFLVCENPNGYIPMKKDTAKKVYSIPVKSSLTENAGKLNLQIKITQTENENGVPIFMSKTFELKVGKSINADSEMPDKYADWKDEITGEVQRLDEDLQSVSTQVETNTQNIATNSSDIKTLRNDKQDILTAIDAEATARKSADNTLQANIDSEATARANADTELKDSINENTTKIDANTTQITALQSGINENSTKINANTTQISTLQGNINAEATARTNADTTLQNGINTNATKIDANTTQISTLQSGKQDKLTAGTNITIENNTISASCTAPANMMTTDTMQTITNDKIFYIDGQLNTGFVAIAKNLNGDTTLNLKESVSGGNVEMSYGKLNFNKGSTTYTQTLPEKSGTFAMTSDIDTAKSGLQTNIDSEATARADADAGLQSSINANATSIANLQNSKVNKETGKGLSTNDFTNEYKTKIDTNATNIANNTTQITALQSGINENSTKIDANATQISALQSGKQDKLTAGANITIENNTISASGTAPANMVTTDTAQTITGTKIFGDNFSTVEIVNEPVVGHCIKLASSGNSLKLYPTYFMYNSYAQELPKKNGTFAMTSDITSSAKTLQTNIDNLTNSVAGETSARESADTTLQTNINNLTSVVNGKLQVDSISVNSGTNYQFCLRLKSGTKINGHTGLQIVWGVQHINQDRQATITFAKAFPDAQYSITALMGPNTSWNEDLTNFKIDEKNTTNCKISNKGAANNMNYIAIGLYD